MEHAFPTQKRIMVSSSKECQLPTVRIAKSFRRIRRWDTSVLINTRCMGGTPPLQTKAWITHAHKHSQVQEERNRYKVESDQEGHDSAVFWQNVTFSQIKKWTECSSYTTTVKLRDWAKELCVFLNLFRLYLDFLLPAVSLTFRHGTFFLSQHSINLN